MITAIEVPGLELAAQSTYTKYRDRESYEFALVSIFLAVHVENGRVAAVRLALGGVGTRPWRARRAEQVLVGADATPETFAAAADAELAPAVTRTGNAFKVELAKRAIVRGLSEATGGGGR
jgi:xanthine dehydrogenase YagS FAD-binding subunit